MSYRIQLLIELVQQAIQMVYERQYYLIENKVHERSIVFWFGIYFNEIIKKSEFSEYNLDFEYNKNHSDPKRTDNFPQGTYPDIILHKRGTNKDNLLIMEFKTYWGDDTDKDLCKLKDFTNNSGKYNYELGLSIVLCKDKERFTKIANGEISE
ncbi:MAG: hypothetical protein JEY94_07365 [Melioribacteraceae bacterium]|nr:hypothetical protein [Melioribacteraceae bacterium]